jgi:Na+-translocating ferredoxin:NAD+ oxidoreductase RNF subunit RnfB
MIASKEYKEDLIKFADKLRYKSQSFPKDENGSPTETYLEYISMMYDPEMIKVVLHLDVFPKMTSLIKLSKKTGIDKKELDLKIEPVAKRGFILKMGPQLCLPTPLFVYDMPFILKENYSREDVIKLAQLSRKFFIDDQYYKTWENKRDGTPRMRVLTVSEEVESEHQIQPIEEVYNIIDQFEDFALIPCPCRKRTEVEGIRECKDKYPIHNCIIFGTMAKTILEFGDPVIKAASKEEIKKITQEAAEIGLVHATDNWASNTTILCACCECCCGMLRGITRFDNPRAIAKANYISTIDEELCTGCETCLSRCKFEAIKVNGIAKINVERCLGCGLCAVTCPSDAIQMKRFEREEIPKI